MELPLKVWYCDVCHKKIENPAEANVIWRKDSSDKLCNFKIVHKKSRSEDGCDDNITYPFSLDLANFLGVNGLSALTSMLSSGIYNIYDLKKIELNSFVDLFRRCQVPYYEEARKYFSTIETKEFLGNDNETHPYYPDVLKKIIEINQN